MTSPVSAGLWLDCQPPTRTAKAALNQLACSQCPQVAAPLCRWPLRARLLLPVVAGTFQPGPRSPGFVSEAGGETQAGCPMISWWSQQAQRAQPTLTPCLDMSECLFEQTQITGVYVSKYQKRLKAIRTQQAVRFPKQMVYHG